MATTIAFTVYGTAQSRGSKTPWNPRRKDGSLVLRADGRPVIATMDDNKKSKNWMAEVRAAAAGAFSGELLTGPIELTCAFYFARPTSHYGTGRNSGKLKPSAPIDHTQKPDLSKITRAVEDAMTKVIWRDDSQINRYGHGHGKHWTFEQSRVEIKICCNCTSTGTP